MISVILNAYKRTDHLERQLEAIKNQTIKPEKIYVWQNAGGQIPEHLKSEFILAECSENLGVWSRFAYALNVDTEYVCVFDDDTIPGLRWFENCLKTMEIHEGLLGTRGLRFLSPKRYHPFNCFGWDAPNQNVERVDIVGHAWFFKREWLGAFWGEMPPVDASKIAGEDIHFSYAIQKRLNLNTYVPPHPEDDTSFWGSLPEYATRLGTDSAAISGETSALSRFDIALSYYTSRGFGLCMSTKDRLKDGVVIGSGIRTNSKIRTLVEKFPFLLKLGKMLLRVLEKLKIHI